MKFKQNSTSSQKFQNTFKTQVHVLVMGTCCECIFLFGSKMVSSIEHARYMHHENAQVDPRGEIPRSTFGFEHGSERQPTHSLGAIWVRVLYYYGNFGTKSGDPKIYEPLDPPTFRRSELVRGLKFFTTLVRRQQFTIFRAYIDFGDRCWRQNLLVTSLRC